MATTRQTDDKGRRILANATVDRVMADALTADDLVFSPLGAGYASGVAVKVTGELFRDPTFAADLNALVAAHASAHYAYIRTLLAFGYQLARDDRGERP